MEQEARQIEKTTGEVLAELTDLIEQYKSEQAGVSRVQLGDRIKELFIALGKKARSGQDEQATREIKAAIDELGIDIEEK